MTQTLRPPTQRVQSWDSTDARGLRRLWPLVLAAGALCVLVGGALHPRANAILPFDGAVNSMLVSGAWIPAHALILVGLIVLTPGLWFLGRSLPDQSTVRSAARVAVAAAGLSVIEMVVHLAAHADQAALVGGRSTPILDTHLALQTVANPALGFSVATLLVVGARARLWHWVIAVIGGAGGVLFGLAGPSIAATRNPHVDILFIAQTPMSIALIAVALLALRRPRPVVTPA